MSHARAIAIVGRAGRFPGAADVHALFTNVLAKRSAVQQVPDGRWPAPAADMVDPAGGPDLARSARACLLDPYPFDEAGLDLPTELLARLSPLAKLTLSVGRDAFADAHLGSIDRDRVGIILANIALPTDGASKLAEALLFGDLDERYLGEKQAVADPLERYPSALPAGLLARALGLGAGTYTLDAACASSLYSLYLACEELEARRMDAVLAGGVSLPQALYTQVGFTQLHALSPSGTCAPFDTRADGLVVGEGAGMVVLRRLEDALRDDNRIYAVIRGIGLSNDVGGSLLSPDPEGQLRATRAAYTEAGWSPDDVDLIECHGTGTPRGDAVELASLRALWQDLEPRGCVLGSVKSNVGHLLTAAGAAGLCKVLGAFESRTLPPSANFEAGTAAEALRESPFRVLEAAEPWPERAPGRPRRAAVSGFGFGGINAHVLLEEHVASTGATRAVVHARAQEPCAIAIVGMATHFGPLDSLARFQHALFRGEPVREARPAQRWMGLAGEDWLGAWIDTFAMPLGRFRIPPKEMEALLPQQLLTLKVAAEALAHHESAGAGLGAGPHVRAGVVVGLGLDLDTTTFHLRWLVPARVRAYARARGVTLSEQEASEWVLGLQRALGPALDATRTLGALGGIVASRLAREFQLGGPSFGVSGEEASGLRAVEVASRLLQRRQADVMLAAAVDLAGDVRQVLATDRVRRYSRTGRASPFDARSDGVTVAEGAASVVLKRLDDALRDGDRVYAVLKGFGAASGAALEGGAARRSAYARAMTSAQREARVEAADVSLVVAHGSGDPSDDADELSALCDVLGPADEPRCALAAASSVVGHAGAASGLASVVAAALALHEQIVPPMVGYRSAKDGAPLQKSGMHVPIAAQHWLRDRANGPRRAGVSAMGTDGTCLHAVLESAPHSAPHLAPGSAVRAGSPRPLGPRSAALFLCRGDEAELRSLAASHEGDLEVLAARFHRRGAGKATPVTRAVVAESLDHLRAELARPRPAAAPVRGDVAFVFPGSGNHYVGMGQALGTALPDVYRRLDAEVEHLAGHLMPGWVLPHRASWEPGWEDDAARVLASAPERLILGQVAHGIAVHDAVRLFGVEPRAYVGYSLGESAGLFSSRTWRDRDRMFHRTLSSPLFRTELCGPCTVVQEAWGKDASWRVVLVNRPAKEVTAALSGTASLLIVNAPDECVVGGSAADVATVVQRLDCGVLDIEGVPTVHLPLMEPVADAYRALHVLPATPPPGVRFYSGAWGRSYAPSADLAADSIVTNARHGFDFPKTIEAAYADGARIFVELGPQGSCTRMIHRILAGRDVLAVTACVRGQDGYRSLLACLGKLAEAGVPVTLDAIYGHDAGIEIDARPVGAELRLPVGHRRPAPPPMPLRINSAPLGNDAPRAAPAPVPVPVPVPAHAHAHAHAHDLSQLAAAAATTHAHEAFLKLAQSSMALQTQALLEQQRLLAMLAHTTHTTHPAHPAHAPARPGGLVPSPAPATLRTREVPAFDRAMCMEFAVGSLARTLGPMFAPVDRHRTRVRLPDEPLMLCDRILRVEGEKGVLGPGRCITEHDVLPGAWYLDAGRAPVCISVEAGQADLFLSAYLGIDLETRGERVYRLLDAKIVLHRDLPRVGETIRYDIRIDRFIRQGDTWLFFFRFDGTIDGEPFITMYDGCAGFFSDEQLATGRGIVGEPSARTEQAAPRRHGANGLPTPPFAPLLPPARASYGAQELEALRRGDLGAAFGGPFQGRTLTPQLRLPSGRMHLVDRIVALDTEGGRLGLGFVHGEADVTPDAWYLTCHFEGDPVMPGTLMYECCLHTLRVLLLRMGLVAESTELDVHYAPIEGVASKLRCRGQVLPTTKTVAYKVEITEIGYDPEPYVLANAAMYSDGRYIVEMQSMSVRVRGLSREGLEALWEGASERTSDRATEHPSAPAATTERFTRAQILAYAEGNPSACFGAPYEPFDHDRRLARLPRPPFLFVDRVVSCDAAPWVVQPTGWVECEFDVPPDAWYFAGNRQSTMPFAVLLEAALQPCGWLAAYVGSALTSEQDLHFRNLDGFGTAFEEVRADVGTLTMRARLTKTSTAGGMLLQEFDMEILRAGHKVYAGHTGFGFFPSQALAQQVGVRGAKMEDLPAGARPFALPKDAPLTPDDCATFPAPKATGLALPARAFLMVDAIDALDLTGGARGLGFVSGHKRVNPDEWFFEAHFYQDPVIPGSLGLEALLQLMKVFARERFGDRTRTHRAECMALGRQHRWQYRGQVIPTHTLVTMQASITSLEDGDEPLLVADGHLAVDGRVIYAMKDFSLRLVREERGRVS